MRVVQEKEQSFIRLSEDRRGRLGMMIKDSMDEVEIIPVLHKVTGVGHSL